MKKIVVSLTFIIAAIIVTACETNDSFIKFEKLPGVAQSFVKKHFADLQISYVKQDDDGFEVKFSNGYEVEFDRKGDWDNVDCNHQPVPQSVIDLLPKDIPQYITSNFYDSYICQVDKNRKSWDIELSNGLELTFDAAGQFIRMDAEVAGFRFQVSGSKFQV